MKYKIFPLAVTLCVLASCHQQEQLKAKIFERRELKGNRLRIKFEYQVNNKLYADSATIANVTINSDSIGVIIDPSNPSRALPDFK